MAVTSPEGRGDRRATLFSELSCSYLFEPQPSVNHFLPRLRIGQVEGLGPSNVFRNRAIYES